MSAYRRSSSHTSPALTTSLLEYRRKLSLDRVEPLSFGDYGSSARADSTSSSFGSYRKSSELYRQSSLDRPAVASSSSTYGLFDSPRFPTESAYRRKSSEPFSTDSRDSNQQLSDDEQQKFLRRLLEAHSLVDDLLKGRGHKTDDERKYLRYREAPEPAVFEPEKPKRPPFVQHDRSLSSTSDQDSGLSIDGDSDVAEPTSDSSDPPSCPIPRLSAIRERSFSVESESDEDDETVEQSEDSVIVEDSVDAVFCASERFASAVAVLPVQNNAVESASASFRQPAPKKKAGSLPSSYDSLTSSPSCFMLPPPAIPVIVAATAQFRRRKVARCSAEISVQHVSFCSVSKTLAFAEKTVRIHLRLTQRAPTQASTSIVLMKPTQTVRVGLTIPLPSTRSSPQIFPRSSLKKTVPAHARPKPIPSPIKVPLPFLSPVHVDNDQPTRRPLQRYSTRLIDARRNLRPTPFHECIGNVLNPAVYYVSEVLGAQLEAKPPKSPRKPDGSPRAKTKTKSREGVEGGRVSRGASPAGRPGAQKKTKSAKNESARRRSGTPAGGRTRQSSASESSPLLPVIIPNRRVIPKPRFILRQLSPPMRQGPPIVHVDTVQAPKAVFVRRKSPTRIPTASVVSQKVSDERPSLKPLNSRLPAHKIRKSPAPCAREPVCSKTSAQWLPRALSGPFGVSLKPVDREAHKRRRPIPSVTNSGRKKPWVPKWRRVEG